MDAPSLSPARSRELADLRRRAYGPNADIQRDPAAQQRLSELEDLARGSAPVQGDEPEAAVSSGLDVPTARSFAPKRPLRGSEASAPPAEEQGPADPTPLPDDSAPADSVPAAEPRGWWRRVPLWSVAAVAGVAVGLVLGLAWPTDSEPPPDLTLEVEPGGGERGAGFTENLNYWGVNPGSVVPHQAFDVIQVWTARAVDDSRCLLLSHDGGFLSATCSGAGLDPVLDFTVYDGMSLELDEPLPVGTVIRFVGRSGHVDVWVSTPGGQAGAAEPSTSSTDSAPSAA